MSLVFFFMLFLNRGIGDVRVLMLDRVPWGWEMSDEEWEEFSKPDQKCNYNRSNDPDELLKLWRWEHPELW